jgi:hypothetical protein
VVIRIEQRYLCVSTVVNKIKIKIKIKIMYDELGRAEKEAVVKYLKTASMHFPDIG